MANKKGVVREDLKLARKLAALARCELQKSAPEQIARWQTEWQKAQAEVKRLQRELTS